jgi:outer membrane biosynthesis protein TonB
MANKKKTKKRPAKSKPSLKKTTKKVKRPKKSAKKKPAPKRVAAKRKAAKKKPAPKRRGRADAEPFSTDIRGSRFGGESGDLQGLSNVESADSESVGELLEEGNAFEADAVKGVEDAGDFDEKEVVPREYLDEE